MSVPVHLHILDISRDGNGHVQVKCRIDDTTSDPQTGTGALEILGIDSLELATRYRGDVERWLQKMGADMLSRHRARTAVHASLHHLKGKKLELRGHGHTADKDAGPDIG